MSDLWLLSGCASAGLFVVAVGGYFVDLLIAGRRRWAPPPPPEAWPAVDVVVPVHDEIRLLASKIANLRALDYPPDRIHAVVVDGASTDGTGEAALALAPGTPPLHVLSLPVADKTAQLNAGFRAGRSPWILVTDADAELPPGTLRALLAEALRHGDTAVVGASALPADAHSLDDLHWRVANALRLREGRMGAASIVTGPCYLLRRDVVSSLPEDVVADDVHVAMAAAAAGFAVRTVDAPVREMRAGVSTGGFLRHKARKTDAYLREVIRFLPRAGSMRGAQRRVFLWRASHLLLVPVLVLHGAVLTVRWLGMGAPGAPWLAAAAAAALAAAAARGGRRRVLDALRMPVVVAVLSAVIVAALLCLPFWRQSARLTRVRS